MATKVTIPSYQHYLIPFKIRLRFFSVQPFAFAHFCVQELCIISESDILAVNSDCILVRYDCLPVLQLLPYPFSIFDMKYMQTLLLLWYSSPYMHASCGFVRKSVELPYKTNNNGSTLDLRNIAKSNFSAQWLSADNKKSHSLF